MKKEHKWIIFFVCLAVLFLAIWQLLLLFTAQKTNNTPSKQQAGIAYKPEVDTSYYQIETLVKSEIWDILQDIDYKSEGIYGYIPTFTNKHKALMEKNITIEGYIYPLETAKIQKFFMLSALPVSACFFCGGAGPETVVEVNSPNGIPMSDKLVKITGKLKLNTTEPERLFYILNEASVAN